MQSDWLNSALGSVVYGDIALSINTQYNTSDVMSFNLVWTWFHDLLAYSTSRLPC